MNFVDQSHAGTQPVWYENVSILQADSKPEAFVEMDWAQGLAQIYSTREEAINGVPARTLLNLRVAVPPETANQYISEATRLLERGLSLLHPHCTCRHGLTLQRWQTLGITHDSLGVNPRSTNAECPLSRIPREFSAAELSLELAIEDVCTFSLNGVPLVYLLEKHCNTRIDPETGLYFASGCFYFGPIRWSGLYQFQATLG